mgnify:FL=1
MDIFAQFATDPNLELEGKWFNLGPATRTLEGGKPDPASVPRIKVARHGNKRHSRIVSQLYEANKSLLEMKNDAAEQRGIEIAVESMAKGILLGWENLSFKGTGLPDGWDYETAVMLLQVKDFRELVGRYANDFAEYRLVKDEAAAGN